jgi:hypothetical protein
VTIQPIQTRYAGCRFRSRTEARTAVFLDHLGIAWAYEQQGYTLPSGARYLPDFHLPELKIFLEIKGAQPSGQDLAKVREFAVEAKAHGYVTLVLTGDIPRTGPSLAARAFAVQDGTAVDVVTRWTPGPAPRVAAALTAARSARFEFGECG